MSLGQVSKTGAKVPIAGLNGLSGELVPSVSYYQTGKASIPIINANSYEDTTVTLTTPMPDTDYIVYCVDYSGGGGSRFVFSNVPEAQKTTTSFRVRVFNAGDTNTTDYGFQWYAIKLMTDESRALDEAAIAANTTAITNLQSRTVKDNTGQSVSVNVATNGRFTLSRALPSGSAGVMQVVFNNSDIRLDTTDESGTVTSATLSTPTSSVESGNTSPVTSGGVYAYMQANGKYTFSKVVAGHTAAQTIATGINIAGYGQARFAIASSTEHGSAVLCISRGFSTATVAGSLLTGFSVELDSSYNIVINLPANNVSYGMRFSVVII